MDKPLEFRAREIGITIVALDEHGVKVKFFIEVFDGRRVDVGVTEYLSVGQSHGLEFREEKTEDSVNLGELLEKENNS
jgi:hypothetical protein